MECRSCIKVKKSIESEYKYFTKDKLLSIYLHLASSKESPETLTSPGIIAVAYKTVAKSLKLPYVYPNDIILFESCEISEFK